MRRTVSVEVESSPTKITYLPSGRTQITLRRCRLIVQRNGKIEEHTFDRDVITVGATEDNDLAIGDETVSRQHCRIFMEGGGFMIRDLDSTNGTFVNRVRVREAWLKPDCTITLGTSELRFKPIDERVDIVPSEEGRLGEIIGRNQKMREIYSILEKIAPTDATVVVEGETGTGKEVVARTIHNLSRRREGPFIVFDCGAVPENLIESELFGHEKGSFTGAISTRQGVFEMANGGTVFLDELGELQLDLQPKLLRCLEQREVKRVGGVKPIKVDVRVVAATNRNLEKEVRAGRFREDLFYRLSVVRLILPPLRERKEDIPVLIKHFLKGGNYNRNADGSRKVGGISHEAMERLVQYDWPGNVRELHNVVERAVSFADTDQVEVRDLPDHVALRAGQKSGFVAADTRIEPMPVEKPSADASSSTFKDAKEQWISVFERDYIQALLERNDNNISHAAREADIDRKYFRKLMKKYGIGAYGDSDDGDGETEEGDA
jgi:transcriptional regulator with GAF, ATPase, and Fis domain